jgi:group I intron endonuclease
MLPTITGIYAIRRKSDGAVYIGQAKNCRVRFNGHKHKLRKNAHGNPRLQNAWNHYGSDAFEFVILESCVDTELTAREQAHIDNARASGVVVFNCGTAADCPNRGRVLKPLSDEHKRKIADALRGKTKSAIECEMIGKRSRGRKASPETRAKQRAAKLGRKQTPEHIAKAANARVGRPHPVNADARSQLIARNKARVFTDETRNKMRAASLGRAHSETIKERCRQAAIAYWAARKQERLSV